MNTNNKEESEIQLIEKTVNYYLNGLANNNLEMISNAFHKNATMKYIADEYKEVNALEFFKTALKPGAIVNRKTRISSIHFIGNASNVQVEMELSTYSYFDYLNLLKIDGRWQIVSEIYYKKDHIVS